MDYNCALIKEDWLAACIALRVVGALMVVFIRRWSKIGTISATKPIYEEIFQTLLTNKKQVNLDLVHVANANSH